MKQDPSAQQHHTFGASPAAERLKREIDKPGATYASAVRLLHAGERRGNELINSNLPRKHYWLLLLRREVVTRMSATTADDVIKSLCRNVFVTRVKKLMKLNKQDESKPHSES